MNTKHFVALVTLFGILGCDNVKNKLDEYKSKISGEEQLAQPVSLEKKTINNNTETKVVPTAGCENGEEPIIQAGECSGVWKLEVINKKTKCNFAWGPTIKCPEGMASLGHQAECYGVTSKEIDSGDNISTPEDCAKKFGKRPMVANYNMQCCPI